MQIIHTVKDLRETLKKVRQARQSIGFVPTMGNLHSGHVSLVSAARKKVDFTVASVFVNPTQFGVNEDLDSYPRTLDADSEKLTEAGLDLLFAPSVNEMYPNGLDMTATVSTPGLANILCGRSRPTHFAGVATVVSKLFNMVGPDFAFFGEKDFQQLLVIRTFTKELCFPVEIVGVPTVRESSGLAMSSRNGYLSEGEKVVAALLYQQLNQCANALASPEFIISTETIQGLCDGALVTLADEGFVPDYFTVLRQQDLKKPTSSDKKLVILVAAKLGATRLIDNLKVNL